MRRPRDSTTPARSACGEQPTLELERALWRSGAVRVAGLDEVGRGALAGPVVAAACVLPVDFEVPAVFGDSKMLSPQQRRRLADWLRARAVAWSVGAASHREIDRLGIVQATALAMRRALERLGRVDFVLYDGRRLPGFEDSWSRAVVEGDQRCASIAAASILAKVLRDALMQRLATRYPGYGWERNVGYPTAQHREALERLGVTPFHRRSFLRNVLGSPTTES